MHELASPTGVAITQDGGLVNSEELLFMDLSLIMAATDDFSDSNKLGKGGFGSVYKVIPTSAFMWSNNCLIVLKLSLIRDILLRVCCQMEWK